MNPIRPRRGSYPRRVNPNATTPVVHSYREDFQDGTFPSGDSAILGVSEQSAEIENPAAPIHASTETMANSADVDRPRFAGGDDAEFALAVARSLKACPQPARRLVAGILLLLCEVARLHPDRPESGD